MKKRQGFVSNSSSSSFSFIIGYGTVKNEQLLKEYMNHHKLKFNYDFTMFSYTEHCPVYKKLDAFYHEYGEPTEIFGGNNTSLTLPEDMRNESTLIVSINNHEGDEEFLIYNDFSEYGDLDYSKANKKDYYAPEQQAIIELFEQPFIENGNVIFGAERNG